MATNAMQIIQFDDCGFDWKLGESGSEGDDPPRAPETARILRCFNASGSPLEHWFAALVNQWTMECVSKRPAAEKQRAGIVGQSDAERAIDPGRDGIYLIHANGCFSPNASRQDAEGIEILKHIRLTEALGAMRSWHAIVYSFEPPEAILRRKPGNLLLFSPGVTFLRLPDALRLREAIGQAEPAIRQTHRDERSNAVTLDTLLTDKRIYRAPEGAGLRPFIACDYRPPDSEHAISNWWGVRQLIISVRKIAGSADDCTLPSAVQTELTHLENKKAFYLAAADQEDAASSQRGGAREQLKKLRALFDTSNGVRPPKIVYVDDEMDKGWDAAMFFLLTGKTLTSGNAPAWYDTTMAALSSAENDQGDWKVLADTILEQNPALILIDLRLLGSSDAGLPVKDTSGGRLVGLLREKASAVPILLMTASNKATTLQEAFRLGIDAYWMKEGIGDHSSPATSVHNTAELIRLIRNLLEADYRVLQTAEQTISKLERTWDSARPPWWKRMQWPYPTPPLPVDPPLVTEADKASIFALLRNLVRMYREYLRLFTLRYGSVELTADRIDPNGQRETEDENKARTRRKEETIDFWLRSLVVQIGRIIEAVHCFEIIRRDQDPLLASGQRSLASAGTIGGYPVYRDRRAQKVRRDWFGQALYDIRNSVAHYDPDVPALQHENLRSLIAALFAWLSVKPCCSQSPRNLNVGSNRKNTSWPKAADFISGPDKYGRLIVAYRKLYGSSVLDLPARVPRRPSSP